MCQDTVMGKFICMSCKFCHILLNVTEKMYKGQQSLSDAMYYNDVKSIIIEEYYCL
jgi:hypothetical protein